MKSGLVVTSFMAAGVVVLSGCGSAYSGLSNTSDLGAAQYMPAVYVEPGNETKYQQVLGVCRQVAANRQATAAQKAQLETITGVAEGAGAGAAAGIQIGSILDNAGFDTNVLEAAIGAAAGAIAGVAGAFAKGANTTAEETRRILLNCLRETSKEGSLWQVLE